MAYSYVEGHRKQRITLFTQSTTTVIPATTTLFVTADNTLPGYSRGWLITSVVANASGSPEVRLQISADGGTNWHMHATIHPDMTTTANTSHAYIASMTENVRLAIINTTSSSTRFVVKCEATI